MDGSGLWTKDVGSVDGWPAGVDQSTHIRDRMTTHLHETYPRPLPSNNPSLRRMDCMAPVLRFGKGTGPSWSTRSLNIMKGMFLAEILPII